jgi:hypothetical protein
MILPGTYIDVFSEGLIAPGQVTVGNLGVVGTAAMGPVGKPVLLSGFGDALAIFGPYDSLVDPDNPTRPRTDSLTLVRALELAFASGASTVYAVRVAGASSKAASATLASTGGTSLVLQAASPGTWGNAISVTAAKPDATDNMMFSESITLTAAQATAKKVTLSRTSADSPRNRATVLNLDGSVTALKVGKDPVAQTGDAQLSGTDLSFFDTFAAGAVVSVTYKIDPSLVVKLTVMLDAVKESYLGVDGASLLSAINDPQNPSTLVSATAGTQPTQLPMLQALPFTGGDNGAQNANYYDLQSGLGTLLDVDAHIIVAAGQSHATAGAPLDQHCQLASNDVYKRDRIAVTGSDFAVATLPPPTATADQIVTFVDKLVGNNLASDRVILVAPGFVGNSSAAEDLPYNPITYPGAYGAAVIAGMLAALDPHRSLTNKPVSVDGLEVKFNNAQLTELVQNRVTAIEIDRGIRVLRGQTTDIGAFREITTRRIVDYAKYGVRSTAAPFIGLLNNERVRQVLKGALNSFLKSMLDQEMLVGYSVDVTATRDEQIKGVVQVTIGLQPVFSINFIHVTMILT